MDGAKVSRVDSSDKEVGGKPHSFTIQPKNDKQMYLSASSEKERENWIQMLDSTRSEASLITKSSEAKANTITTLINQLEKLDIV